MLDTRSITQLDRYRGCLLGGAAGDALGAAVEFDDIATIRRRFGPAGIVDPAEAYGRVGAITDDTQMTLFTAEGVLQADDRLAARRRRPAEQHLVRLPALAAHAGRDRPVGRRARTARPRRAAPHRRAAVQARARQHLPVRAAQPARLGSAAASTRSPTNDSKGCGGVMRAAPCGLVTAGSTAPRTRIGVASAALTHGHPSGYLAAGALALIVRSLCDGRPVDAAVDARDRRRSEPSRLRTRWCARSIGRVELAARSDGAPDVDAARAGVGRRGGARDRRLLRAHAPRRLRRCGPARRQPLRRQRQHGRDHRQHHGRAARRRRDPHPLARRARAARHDRPARDRDARPLRPRPQRRRLEALELSGRSRLRGSGAAHDAYWVTPGRLLAGPYPGAKYGVEAEGKLNDFLDLGVTCFIDLTEEGESYTEPSSPTPRCCARSRAPRRARSRTCGCRSATSTSPRRGGCARSRTRSPARSRPARSSTSTAGAASGAPAPSSAATSSRTPDHSGPEALLALKRLRRRHPARAPQVPGDQRPARHGQALEGRMTRPRLYINHPAELDWLIALEFGRVDDGQPPDCWEGVSGGLRLAARRSRRARSSASRSSTSQPSMPATTSTPRSGTARVSTRRWSAWPTRRPARSRSPPRRCSTATAPSTATGSATPSRTQTLPTKRSSSGSCACKPATRWRTSASAACLYDLGRHHEAYRHLRHYTEIAPHCAWNWCWYGKAAEAIGETAEAKSAYREALRLEALDGSQTDARDRLASARLALVGRLPATHKRPWASIKTPTSRATGPPWSRTSSSSRPSPACTRSRTSRRRRSRG